MYRRIPQVILACAVMSLLWMDLPSPVHAAAGDKEFKAGQKAEALQNYDEAYRQYQMAVRANPSNPQFTAAFERAKFQAGAFHVERGHALRAQDQLEQAATEYQMALAMDPSNAAARQSLESVRAAIAARNTQAQAQEQ